MSTTMRKFDIKPIEEITVAMPSVKTAAEEASVITKVPAEIPKCVIVHSECNGEVVSLYVPLVKVDLFEVMGDMLKHSLEIVKHDGCNDYVAHPFEQLAMTSLPSFRICYDDAVVTATRCYSNILKVTVYSSHSHVTFFVNTYHRVFAVPDEDVDQTVIDRMQSMFFRVYGETSMAKFMGAMEALQHEVSAQ